ncbi:2-hydroxychromene-2-carboxylate isomerase [Pararhodobacter zhoushanensis]|uniref:2-hydroxychromene-2-carboxylate isomerase n=1 Tax=Pararhodobacter zhoushanensis TaxID=2479545 RepID=A0ABT3GTP1_9RHOB|nr:2-hydroxychromene-2-carboxylate isomerase [Pararhodobacter zhoushanensis]MCW1930918.1 2-hydroxychromene-2-carboxylate isomerase [Pararhodobacter zhoushanensis]
MGGSTISDQHPVEFYFDFISPFGFLASLRVDDLAAKYGRETTWTSMLLGVSVMKVMGLKAIPKTPLKGPYMRLDAQRYCRRHGIRFGRQLTDPPANPLAAGRTFHWLTEHDPTRAKPVAKAILAAYWLEGRAIGELDTVLDLAAGQGVDRAALAEAHASGAASALLNAGVEASLAKGVFGSPYFIVDGEPFFGLEKMELLEDWLREGGW